MRFDSYTFLNSVVRNFLKIIENDLNMAELTHDDIFYVIKTILDSKIFKSLIHQFN